MVATKTATVVRDLTQAQIDTLLAGHALADDAGFQRAVVLGGLLNAAYRLGQEDAGALVLAENLQGRRGAMEAAMRRAYAATQHQTWDAAMVAVVLAAFEGCAQADG